MEITCEQLQAIVTFMECDSSPLYYEWEAYGEDFEEYKDWLNYIISEWPYKQHILINNELWFPEDEFDLGLWEDFFPHLEEKPEVLYPEKPHIPANQWDKDTKQQIETYKMVKKLLANEN